MGAQPSPQRTHIAPVEIPSLAYGHPSQTANNPAKVEPSNTALSVWRTSTVVIALGYFLDLWLTHLHLPTMGLDPSFTVDWALSFQDPLTLTAVMSTLLLLAGHLAGGSAAVFLTRTGLSDSGKRAFYALGLAGLGGAVALVSTPAIAHASTLTHVTPLTIDIFGIIAFAALCFFEKKDQPSLRQSSLELLLVSTIAGSSLLAQSQGWTVYVAGIFSFLMFLRLNQVVREVWVVEKGPVETASTVENTDGRDTL